MAAVSCSEQPVTENATCGGTNREAYSRRVLMNRLRTLLGDDFAEG